MTDSDRFVLVLGRNNNHVDRIDHGSKTMSSPVFASVPCLNVLASLNAIN